MILNAHLQILSIGKEPRRPTLALAPVLRWLVLAGVVLTLVWAGLALGLREALARDPKPSPVAVIDADASSLKALPIREYPVLDAGDTFVVLYSGDNGWAKVDRALAEDLSADGLPVVGIDTLRYLRPSKSSDAYARDLSDIISYYGRFWRRSRVILVGYSYGGDVVPLVAERLPPSVRSKISLFALVSPNRYGRLEFEPYHWLDLDWPGSTKLEMAFQGVRGTPVICFSARLEPGAGCKPLGARLARAIMISGDHRYRNQSAIVAGAILSAAGQTPRPAEWIRQEKAFALEDRWDF